MSQILRLTGRFGLSAYKTSDKSFICDSCLRIRLRSQKYSTKVSFETNTTFFKRRRWKKKHALPDKEELHEQLTKMLHARVLQLSSSTGNRSSLYDPEIISNDINIRKQSEPSWFPHSENVNETAGAQRTDSHLGKYKTFQNEDIFKELTSVTDINSLKSPYYNQGTLKNDESLRQTSKSSAEAYNFLKERDYKRSKFKDKTYSLTSDDSRMDKSKSNSEAFKFGNVNLDSEASIVDKLQAKSPESFRQELQDLVQKSQPSSVNKQKVKQKSGPASVRLSYRKQARKAALNEIYGRKNDKIQPKRVMDDRVTITNVSSAAHRKHLKSNLFGNTEYRGLNDAKASFQYNSKKNLSSTDAKAALEYLDVLYESADVGSVTNTVDNETVNTLEESAEEEYIKIDVSDAEWDVLKKIRKAQRYFPPTLDVKEANDLEKLNNPFSEDLSMADKIGLEDIATSDWIQSYNPLEGVLTEKAKKKKANTEQKNISLSDICEQGLIQEQVLIEMFNMDLKTYVEACVGSRMTMRALEDIRFYRSSNQTYHKITDINIYNLIIRGLGREMTSLDVVREVFSMLKEDGIEPTIQTYTLCLSCLGRQDQYDLLIASFILKDMIKMGLDVKDVFNQCHFVHNERFNVFQVLKKLIPDYEPYPPRSTSQYTGSLVEPLNQPLTMEEKVEVNPFTCDMSKDDIMKAAHDQFCKELDQVVVVESVFKTHSKMDVDKAKAIEKTKSHWREKIKEAFMYTKASLFTNAYENKGISMYPFFCLFPQDDYVDILIKELELWAGTSQGFSPQVLVLKHNLADRIHKRFIIQQMIDGHNFPKLHKAYSLYIDQLIDGNKPVHSLLECWTRITETFSDGNSMERPNTVWSQSVKNKLGDILYKLLLENAEVNSNLFSRQSENERMMKGFYEVVRYCRGESANEIRPHPMISYLMNAQSDLIFNVNEVPSLCPPIPYTSSKSGGNFTSTVELVRMCSDKQIDMLEDRVEQCGPVFDSLNILSTYAWKVNNQVLDVILKVFKEGGNTDLDIPILPQNIPKPEKPNHENSKQLDESDRAAMKKYNKELTAYKKEFLEATGLWWSGLYKLSIANQFRDKTFWISMNMDFRGRTYPVASHLNHQGQDFVRALMMFAKGKPLGEKGLNWLKLHLVNLTEFMKRATFKEKLEYAEQVLPEVIDSAENPLTGSKWWMKSENPWQTLGVCIEIAEAIKSGNPADYVSHYPVHQDGSCNGLQHFAALGRDDAGGKSVNLVPADRPADVYSDVVELVMKEIEKDISEKNEDAEIAKICQPFLNRKVIKQSIMTTVYGVTEYGAKLQIQRQLKDREFPEEYILDARNYLTKKTFQCLNSLFVSARQIQQWFDHCSKAIADQNETVEWITPLNFPCEQTYFKDFDRPKHMQKKVYSFLLFDGKHLFRKVNAQKQKNGFSPNFIHSLDSVHMMLTTLYCNKHGITYSSVHDSFWTHACDVDSMNRITREQFIALHEQPILENLSQYFMDVYIKQGNLPHEQRERLMNIFTALPDRGGFDLKTILNSRYFFS
ncbi:hypothetical protein ACF0H5_019755 [Mactra antiquata]